MPMNTHTMFLIQLAGAVGVGGFIGELYRTATNESINARIFISNFLAGAFLSFMLGYLLYLAIDNRPFPIAIGALLSYQDERFLKKLVRRMVAEVYRISMDEDDEGDKKGGGSK